MPRADRIGDWLNGIARTSRSEAGSTIVDNVDKALAKMVSEGNADKAAEGFRYFADQAADSGVSIKGAKDMLPGYTAALEEADAAARNSGYVTADLADTVARLTEEWYANANAALGLSNAQIGAAEALVRANELAAEGARISYDQSGAFNLMDESTRNAVGGLNALAEANLLANEQIRQMYGEDSPQLQAALAAQRESFIQAGIQFGLTREQAAAYADQLGQIPTAPATTASLAKAADWDKTYFEIMTGLDGLARTRTAKINVSAGIGLGGLAGVGAPALTSLLLGDSYAEGGQISGPGSGTSDSILARVSNGEHVLTAADVRAMGGQQNVYKFRETLHSYATGGAVDYRAAAHAIPVSQMAHADTSPSSQTFNTTVVGRPTASDWSIAQKVATQLAWQMKASGGVG